MSVLRSTGPHPTYDYKVHPFTPELDTIIIRITKEIKQRILSLKGKLCFNFMERKMYLGEDMFCDNSGSAILICGNKPMCGNGNKKIGPHNHMRIGDNGKQHKGDIADCKHPTVTISIGTERTLTFVRTTKEINQKAWKKCDTKYDTDHVLKDRLMFILLPDDKTPVLFGESLHKTKHRVLFKGSGTSYALVFRLVLEDSVFDICTNNWFWKTDHKCRRRVEDFL